MSWRLDEMTVIDTTVAFNAMLKKENAVLFIFAEWSAPAMKRHAVVKAWEDGSFIRRAPPGTQLFSVQPWGFDEAYHWIYAQPQLQFRNADGHLTCLAAYGTLVWLRFGIVVNVARHFSPDLCELDRLTQMAFTP